MQKKTKIICCKFVDIYYAVFKIQNNNTHKSTVFNIYGVFKIRISYNVIFNIIHITSTVKIK